MIDLAARAGVKRIILNGSFISDIIEPNDVDCVLLTGARIDEEIEAESEIRNGLPFLDIALVRGKEFDRLTRRFFAYDRERELKGMVELIL